MRMMDFTASQWLQLHIAAIFAVVAFIALYITPARSIIPALILVIPFQIISSRYGSLNIYLIYLIAFMLALRGYLKEFPYMGFIAAIAFAYALSLSQSPLFLLREHLLYLIQIGAGFAVFFIMYNHYTRDPDSKAFIRMMLLLNFLVVLYTGAQLIVGMNPNSPLFNDTIGLRPPRDDGRLTGPFGTVGLTAEYLVIAIFICGFALMTLKPSRLLRWGIIALILGNLAAMIATANRGAIIALILAGTYFLYLFRKELGPQGLSKTVIGIGLAFSLTSALVINFTDFNRLFERFAETEVEEGLPDTRSVTWPMAWAKIVENPITGYGPQLKFSETAYANPAAPELILWPHNLYLFLLYTVGTIGLMAYLAFFARLYAQFFSASAVKTGDLVLDGLPRLGMVILAVFLIDQMKIEFLRDRATEFQHLIFMLWGAIAAFSVHAIELHRQKKQNA
jgi:hypothetical protein